MYWTYLKKKNLLFCTKYLQIPKYEIAKGDFSAVAQLARIGLDLATMKYVILLRSLGTEVVRGYQLYGKVALAHRSCRVGNGEGKGAGISETGAEERRFA